MTEDLSEVNGTPEDLAAGSTSSVSDIDTEKETESSKPPVPESTYWSENELNMNSQDELGDRGSPLETLSGGSAYYSAGIPAPSIPFQVNPGNILVPAAADQVQCQAFSALQVLKVILFLCCSAYESFFQLMNHFSRSLRQTLSLAIYVLAESMLGGWFLPAAHYQGIFS